MYICISVAFLFEVKGNIKIGGLKKFIVAKKNTSILRMLCIH